MKKCCLCGKSGHEASECTWHRAVPMSKVGHATFTVKDEVSHALYAPSRNLNGKRIAVWHNQN